eukprot:4223399-Heterocapsa_arctica.AAC.1
MAYLEGLSYHPQGSSINLTETRAGVPQYSGTAYDFQEWKFRILTKKLAIEIPKPEDRDQKSTDLVSRITDALTEDALKIAMDIGSFELSKPG